MAIEGDDNCLLKAEEGRTSQNIGPDFVDSVCNKITRTTSELLRYSSIDGRETESTVLSAAESNILRVPNWLRSSVIKHLYEPSVVSIGPHHRNKPHLQEMQQYKWPSVGFIFRSKSSTESYNRSGIEKCVKKLKELEGTARRYYDKDVIKDLTSDEFLEMMLTDGCFILVFFICPTLFEILVTKDDVFVAIEEVMDDLLLMDNQIPFSILKAISGVAIYGTYSLHHDEFSYLSDKLPSFWKIVCTGFRYGDASDTRYGNLLDAYHFGIITGDLASYYYSERKELFYINKSIQLGEIVLSFILSCFWCDSCHRKVKKERKGGQHINIHSASSLQDKGVIFKKANTVFLAPEVRFSSDGTMTIPCISIEDTSTMNLLAFEQRKYWNAEQKEKGTKNRRHKVIKNNMHISLTIYFIASMLKTSTDLELLQNYGIIEIGHKHSDENAKELFKMFRNNLQLNNNEEVIDNLCQQINKFMNSRRSQWRATLKKDYFGNPWSILSLLAAIMLLVMTFLQTFFSTVSYLHELGQN